jgi:gluconolactonase
VDAFDYSSSAGTITNRRTAFDFKANGVDGIPDGMTIDADGNLWVAVFDGGKVSK